MGLTPAAAAESLSTPVRSSSGYICGTHLVFAHLGSSIAPLIRCHLKCDKVLALTTLARAAPTALFHQLQLWLPRLQHRLLLSGAVRRLNKTTLPLLPPLFYCPCATRTLSTWRVFQTPLTVFHLCSSVSHFISTLFTISFLYFPLSFLTCSIFSSICSISIEYFILFLCCLHIKLHLFSARFFFCARLPVCLPASFVVAVIVEQDYQFSIFPCISFAVIQIPFVVKRLEGAPKRLLLPAICAFSLLVLIN